MFKPSNDEKRIIFLQSSLFSSQYLGNIDKDLFFEFQEKLEKMDSSYSDKRTGIIYEDTLTSSRLSTNILKIIKSSRSVPIKEPNLEDKLEVLKPFDQVFVVVDNLSKGYRVVKGDECNHINFQKLYLQYQQKRINTPMVLGKNGFIELHENNFFELLPIFYNPEVELVLSNENDEKIPLHLRKEISTY